MERSALADREERSDELERSALADREEHGDELERSALADREESAATKIPGKPAGRAERANMRHTRFGRAGTLVLAAILGMLCPSPGHFSLSVVASGRSFAFQVASHNRVIRAVVLTRHSKKAASRLPFAVIIVTKAADTDCA